MKRVILKKYNTEERKKLFVLKPLYQRSIIVAAGPIANFILAIVIFLSIYMFLLYYTVMWFMDLPDPSFEQSGLISIVVGSGAAWFGLYAGTSNSSKKFKGEK